jgi:hypothetical protein
MLPNLVLFGLLAMGLAAALALFLSLKYELRVQTRKDRARLDAMLQRLQDAERPAPEPAASTAPSAPALLRSGMNINKRVQAVRLLRRGEDVSHVAAALGVSRREIELLLRVQKLSAQRASAAGAGSPS